MAHRFPLDLIAVIVVLLFLFDLPTALAGESLDVFDQDGQRQGYIRSPDSGRTLDFFDRDSRRTGYGVQRPDGSWDLFRPDGSRLGTIQPGVGGQPSRILLPKGKR